MINIEFEIAHEELRGAEGNPDVIRTSCNRIIEYTRWLNVRNIKFKPLGLYRVLIDEEYAEDVTAFTLAFSGEFKVSTVKYDKDWQEKNKQHR